MNIKGSFITVFSPELIKGVVQPLVCIVSVPSPTMSRWDTAPHPHAIASTAFHSGDPWHTLGHPGEKSRSREDPFRKDKRQNLWYIPYYNTYIYIYPWYIHYFQFSSILNHKKGLWSALVLRRSQLVMMLSFSGYQSVVSPMNRVMQTRRNGQSTCISLKF